MMKEWVLRMVKKAQFRAREAAGASLWTSGGGDHGGSGRRASVCLWRFMRRALLAALTCIFALGGALVGIVTGALKGQTTETGFVRGAGIGAVAGAVTAVQLLELMVDGHSLSKVALFCSLVDGKVFMEWVGPAVLKAYQWQVSTLETTYREISDIYDTAEERGLSQSCIQRLPEYKFHSSNNSSAAHQASADDGDGVICCSICLQEFKEGESGRRLPKCGHKFHLECLDAWLVRRGSCPMCRDHICDHHHHDCCMDLYGI